MIDKKEIEKIMSKCDKCKLNECIGCEITYAEMESIKTMIKQLEEKLKQEESKEILVISLLTKLIARIDMKSSMEIATENDWLINSLNYIINQIEGKE